MQDITKIYMTDHINRKSSSRNKSSSSSSGRSQSPTKKDKKIEESKYYISLVRVR